MSVEVVVHARPMPVGNVTVARAMPTLARRVVGPFVFLDHMMPAVFAPGDGMEIAPHPHIGLSTVTYLFEGEVVHRDSLGTVQPIRPGELNVMTAGRGIAHSERLAPERRAQAQAFSGVQLWIGLPAADEELPPTFEHRAADELPGREGDGVRLRVLLGEAFGLASPVVHASRPWLVDVALDGAALTLPPGPEQRALFICSGALELDGQTYQAEHLLVLTPGTTVEVRSPGQTRLILLGGPPLDGPRFMDWNFVSSSKERIEAAKAAWRAHAFPPVPGDDGYIPLPEPRRRP
jgi:hypothetical protein